MNPLFLSHIIADFLLQTRQIVKFKQESNWGIAFHSIIHAAVMGLFIIPFRPDFAIGIILISVVHGFADKSKINLQKIIKTDSAIFLADQFIHLLVLLSASILTPLLIPFWQSEKGIYIASGFFAATLIFSIANLLKSDEYPFQRKSTKKPRFLSFALAFLAFFISALIF